MTREEVIAKFGVDPEAVGFRPRGWWIVETIDGEEIAGSAQIGDLCVKTRDGGSNPVDPGAFKLGHCVGSSEDGFDCTYRYYYYRALPEPAKSDMQPGEFASLPPCGTRWRHRKRGTTYLVLLSGKIEATLEPAVIYQADADATIWIRPAAEFLDGRFELIGHKADEQ